MLITNGFKMFGTVVDDVGDVAPQLGVGDCLTLGSYVACLDSTSTPVRFPMPWHVIERQGNKLKLLSYFLFANMGYWDLRDELDTYYHESFTEAEKNAILTTEVITMVDGSPAVTHDKLYVPALEDIQDIPDDLKVGRLVDATKGADGVPVVNVSYCFYWLRDPGDYEDENLIVQGFADSKLYLDSANHESDEVGLRAVMWVDATKLGDLQFAMY